MENDLQSLRKLVQSIHQNAGARRRERRAVYIKVREYYLDRRKEELTQEEIAAELSIPSGTLRRWIRASWREPGITSLDLLAALGPSTVDSKN